MVPIRLYLRNFISYGDEGETLDFSFHVACLSGHNGDGKSALLEAMTWALFGVARGLSASGAGADDLIRSAPGVDEAVVELDFRLGEQVYRVRRSRHRKRGGTLEVAAWDGQEFRRLTSMKKRDTQQMLLDLLRMDYETFVNSSFLLQGQADKFTMQPPGERKRILGQILGLGRYDLLEERAREHARVAKAVGRQYEEEIARLEEEAAQADQCRVELEKCDAAVRTAEEEQARLQERARQAQAAVNDLLQKRERCRQLERQYADIMADRQRICEQAAPLHERLSLKRALLANREHIEAGYRELQEARRQEQELARKSAAYEELMDAAQDLNRQVDAAGERLRAEAGHLEERLRTLAQEAGLLAALQEKETRLRAQIARVEGFRARLAELQAEQAQAQAEIARIAAERNRLAERLPELQQRIDLLTHDHTEARCPLCETPLSEERRLRLIGKFQEEGAGISTFSREQEKREEALRHRLAEVEAEREDLETRVAEADELLQRLGELAEQVARASQSGEQQEELRRALLEVRRRLEEGDFAPEARAALQRNAEAVARLGYDRDQHRKAAEQVRNLADYERQQVEMENGRQTIQEDESALARLEELDQQKAAAAAACLDEGKALEAETRNLGKAQEQLAAAQAALAAVAGDLRRLGEDAARWGERLARCQAARSERDKRAAEKRQAEREAVVYGELAAAFSKRGIQAIIIENVVPQIMEDANELLGRLTGGQMQVSLVTRAANRKGDLAETLEILISDQLGTRRYELYSGGEAFRVNFAVRIALSRLLAQRARANLQTLVIDEGFGTQDSQGRERLVEAIHAVAGDFDRILVITHIEDLKEAFGYRVEVAKDERGSHLTVVG